MHEIQRLRYDVTTVDCREIMHEIQRLRQEQESNARTTANAAYNPTLMAELLLLRQRKDELESRMSALQDSRRDLVTQLEALMKLLKVQGSVEGMRYCVL